MLEIKPRYYLLQLVDWHGLRVSEGEKVCAGCRQVAALKRRKYCAKCLKIALRMQSTRFSRETQNGVWDYVRKHGFVCYYTGMQLDLDDFQSQLAKHFREGSVVRKRRLAYWSRAYR